MVILRAALASDFPAITEVVADAFGKSRFDEAGIPARIRAEGAALVELVAEDAGEIVGHVLFSLMRCQPARFIAGLGPLAVSPSRQREGIGSALSRQGGEACRTQGAEAIVVLGHPTYYPRFGFSAEAAAQLQSPYHGLPAFMALELQPGALDEPLSIDYPAAFG